MMYIEHENATYTAKYVSDLEQGCGRWTLHRSLAEECEKLVAVITYWDSVGQFYFESFGDELPLCVVDRFVAEAKNDP